MNKKWYFPLALISVSLIGLYSFGGVNNSNRDYSLIWNADATYDIAEPSYRPDQTYLGDLDVTSGTVSKLFLKPHIVDYGDTVTARTIVAGETGTAFVLKTLSGNGASSVTFSLPTAAAGLQYSFVDDATTAAIDLAIKANTGDTINRGTAAKYYKCTTDTRPQSVTLLAVDAVDWIILNQVGTWANDNN